MLGALLIPNVRFHGGDYGIAYLCLGKPSLSHGRKPGSDVTQKKQKGGIRR